MTTYGYARVSTDAQDYQGQIDALKAAGVAKGDIIADKASGASLDGRNLSKLISRLMPGDTLLVAKLDRFARSTRDLLNMLDAIHKAGATFRILDAPFLDSTGPYGEFVIGILGSVAQFERRMILSRTREGRARYLAKGGRLGRKAKLAPAQIAKAREMRGQGASFAEIGAVLGVAHTTVSRAIGEATAKANG